MAIVSLLIDWKDPSWVTGNTDVYTDKAIIFLTDGRYARADGITQVQDLTFFGGAAGEWGSITGDINDQLDLQDQFDTKAARVAELITGGVISVGTYGGSGTNNDIRVTASVYYIPGGGGGSAVQTDFLDIALAASGLQRYVGIYATTSNTIVKAEGSEAALATIPATPANSFPIGYILVNDAGLGSSVDLSGYQLKSSKATQASNQTGTNDTDHVTPLANAIKANLASPTFTGVPLVPTAAAGTNTTQAASTAFVRTELNSKAQVYFQWDTTNPLDGLTYFLSTSPLALSTGNSNSRGVAPCTGTIFAVGITSRNNAAASGESSTFKVLVQGSPSTITSAYVFSTQTEVLVTGLSIAVTAGNNLTVSMDCPSWVTNPTNTAGSVTLYIR